MIYSIKGLKPFIHENAGFIAPSAELIGNLSLSEGVNIWFNAVIRGDQDSITIGAGSNIQDCVVIHTDEGFPSVIGEGVTIGHGAVIHGCTIGTNCLVGMNAVVLNGAVIGDNCLVGAGSLVPQGAKIPPNSLVLGSPAKVAKEMRPAMIDAIRKNGKVYLAGSADYMGGLAAL